MMIWRKTKRRVLSRITKNVRRPKRSSAVVRAHYCAHRETARAIITQRVEVLNVQYGFVYNRIAIRNTRSRWGSCSSKKNLNFHYGLLFMPPTIRDYVIVHELCHLQEMNHSRAFWALVEESVPEYRAQRTALRQFSPMRIAKDYPLQKNLP